MPEKKISEIKNAAIPIGVLEGYSYGEPIDSVQSQFKVIYSRQEELIRAVSSGKLRLCVFDCGVAAFLQKKQALDNVVAIEKCTFERPLHVMFSRHQAHLVEPFNRGLTFVYESGLYERINVKYECI